jgi:hypothetical protein
MNRTPRMNAKSIKYADQREKVFIYTFDILGRIAFVHHANERKDKRWND